VDGALRRGASRRSKVGRRSSAVKRADERVFAATLGAVTFDGRAASARALVRERDGVALRGAWGAALPAAGRWDRARAGASTRCGAAAAALRDGARAGAAVGREEDAAERGRTVCEAVRAAGETTRSAGETTRGAAGETARAAGEPTRAAGETVDVAGALLRTFARSCAAMASETAA
jgi:hypothetical protein